ncbi:winged helix-turn-helix domain-containing protein [Erythrobacter sp. YT30]|uniref:winged helix-turn-helix domain-containing protein n=1 Tax=Erythrobacter sp. YT30 TaxID=1735012 RepID=UPI00076BE6FE|nr:winged helix-turn-helix domain-containing protein [Erythrobacter sp. YT30]KWV92704.1 hypothetical protein AUC45_00575 [Erythrobacter sp. YT30]
MTIELAKTDSFSLAELRVQPRLLNVEKGDQTVALEPRVMQVFVLLARHTGDAVDRDTLIEECWGGVIVGDDAIQRCIGRLRRLAAQLGGFEIETIPKIGYRLVSQGQDIPDGSVSRSPTDGPAKPVVSLSLPSFIGQSEKGKTLSLLLSSDVSAALSLNRELIVLAPNSDQSPEFLVGLELREIEDQLRVHCSMTEIASGRILWSDVIYCPARPLLSTGIPAHELVVDLASRFSTIVIREVTESSLALDKAQSAWQAVVRANAAYQQIDLASLARAIEEARAAVSMEPRYAAAHAALANALAAHYELGGAQREEEAEEARKHCDIALALAPEDANVLAWISQALLMITRPAEGMSLAKKAVELAPWHPIAHLYLARHYLHQGLPAEAEQALDDHSRVAPLFPWKYFPELNRGIARFMLGDLDGAQKHLEEAASLNPRYPYSWISLMVLGALQQDNDLMRNSARRLRQIDGNDDLELQLARLAHSYPDPSQAALVQAAFKTAWTA